MDQSETGKKREYSVAIIGHGWVGKAYHKVFPNATIYDEPQQLVTQAFNIGGETVFPSKTWDREEARKIVNQCEMAIICVPTDPKESGSGALDMSIVEDVVGWLETPLILIKSALQPGTVDRLVAETGKRIAVSVEMVGEGKYFVPYWKYPHAEDPTMHSFLIVGGATETASACADFLWQKMSPDINIHLVTAMEAEITKLMENTWGALKVSFANTIYDICRANGANYTNVLQAWGADGRTEKMHMRVVEGKRGWKSKCYDKDIPALRTTAWSSGLQAPLLDGLIKANEEHLQSNA